MSEKIIDILKNGNTYDENAISYTKLVALLEEYVSLKSKFDKLEKVLKESVNLYNNNNEVPFEYRNDSINYKLSSRTTRLFNSNDLLNIIKSLSTTDADYITALENVLIGLNIKPSDLIKLGVQEYMIDEKEANQTTTSVYTLRVNNNKARKND